MGTELLSGTASPNTNLAAIALALEQAGVELAFHTTVGDVGDRITRTVESAMARADVIILTGGLGPTHDDLTRDALAQATGRPLELDPRIEADLRQLFARRGAGMNDLNIRQAYVPQGAAVMANPLGTAPGLRIDQEGITIFALPGVPAEMTRMLEDHLVPWLIGRGGQRVVVTRTLRSAGLREADLAQRISGIVDECAFAGVPVITLLAAAGEVRIQLRAGGHSRQEAMALIGPVEDRMRRELGNCLYGVDDQLLEGVVSGLLKESGLTVALAESFTGGALASRLVSVPGASLCLRAGFVTYAIEAKVSELGIAQSLLDEYGAVSGQTAMAMARQARMRSGADLGLSTTGEAGPAPEQEPVGVMFIGLAWEGGARAVEHAAAGSRQSIRQWGTAAALNELRLWLLGG